MEKFDMESMNIVQSNMEKIESIFPNCIKEVRNDDGIVKKAIDFDVLKQNLSDDLLDSDERYDFTWVGKKESIKLANTPTRKTLRPIKDSSVEWEKTENLYIEGDNLEVLKLLQESYFSSIKVIYIDPPYNTGSDLIYNDSFVMDSDDYEELIGVYGDSGEKLFRNTDSNGRFHSDWCSMLYPRLMLARNLLSSDGLIFISIGQAELDNTIKICNEVFGERNRAGIVSRQMKTGNNQGKFFTQNIDYLVVYAKNVDEAQPLKDDMSEELIKKVYNKVQEDGPRKGEKYRTMGLFQASLKHGGSTYPITCPDGEKVITPSGLPWRWNEASFKNGLENDEIVFIKSNSTPLINYETGEKATWNIYTKIWLSNRMEEGQLPSDLILKFENRHAAKELVSMDIPFDFPKPVALVKYLLHLIQDKDYTVLDFFSGSATTAHAVMQLNAEDEGKRKFIMVQLPELIDEKTEAFKKGYRTICDIGEKRIVEACKQIKQQDGTKDFDGGFRVFRLDDSNMNNVFYSSGEYTQDLVAMMEEKIKGDRNEYDLLFGCLIDWGIPITMPYSEEIIDDTKIISYNDGDVIACFSKNVTENVVKKMAERKPLRAIFRDDGFANSATKINANEIFKLTSPDTSVRVI